MSLGIPELRIHSIFKIMIQIQILIIAKDLDPDPLQHIQGTGIQN